MDTEIKSDRIIDARNVLCPGPFWELIKAYRFAAPKDVISLYSTPEYDNDTRIDAPKWINKTGNRLIGVVDHDGFYEIIMEKTRIQGRPS